MEGHHQSQLYLSSAYRGRRRPSPYAAHPPTRSLWVGALQVGGTSIRAASLCQTLPRSPEPQAGSPAFSPRAAPLRIQWPGQSSRHELSALTVRSTARTSLRSVFAPTGSPAAATAFAALMRILRRDTTARSAGTKCSSVLSTIGPMERDIAASSCCTPPSPDQFSFIPERFCPMFESQLWCQLQSISE